MNKAQQKFLTFLRLGLGKYDGTSFELTEEVWEAILPVAIRHNVVTLVCKAIESLPQKAHPSMKILAKLESQLIQEIAKNDNQLFAVDALAKRFEENGICGMAVKGIVTKSRYPESAMRSMGDIDILCKGSQNEQVKKTMHSLGYDFVAEGRKHDHYSLPPFVAVEMHRELLSADSDYAFYYRDIWERCHPKTGYTYWYEMTLEDEYLFSLIHLAEHFKHGGIGVRFILDVYVYEHFTELDKTYVENELKKLGLFEFYQNLIQLAEYWFGDTHKVKETSLLKKLGEYVLNNGVYGSFENAAALTKANKGKRQLLKQICPSFESMCSLFPWLGNRPLLLPFAWCVRFFQVLLFRRRNMRILWRRHTKGDKVLGKELADFYHDCGLNL